MSRVVFVVAALSLVVAAHAQLPPAYFGDWTFEYDVDAITDEVSGIITTAATDAPPEAQWNDPSMGIMCSEDDGSVYFVAFAAGTYLGSELFVTVDYRVDKRSPAQGERWYIVEGDWVIPSGDSDAWVRLVSTGQETLTLRLHPATGSSYTYQYSLVGLADALQMLGCE